MILPISAVSEFGYQRLIKPLLFKQKPDAVHERLVKTGQIVGNNRFLRWVLRTSWAYSNPRYLATNIAGVRVENPVGLSAGFDNDFTLPGLIKAVGFGYMEGGSLTLRETPGNPRPWFHRLPHTKSLVVNKGLSNDGVRKIVTRLRRYPANTFEHFPLNISVAKTNLPETCTDDDAIADYIGSLRIIQKASVGSLITINISCPNAYGGEPFTTPKRLNKLLGAIDELELSIPVFIKMPSDLNWEDFKALTDTAATHRVQGLTIHNLAKTREGIDPRDTISDDIKGNLSGKPTWKSSNELIKKTRLAYGDRFTIIGVGGIFSAEDAYTKIRLGADAVELITGMIFQGPQIIGRINRGLVKLLKNDGFSNIADAVGADLK